MNTVGAGEVVTDRQFSAIREGPGIVHLSWSMDQYAAVG